MAWCLPIECLGERASRQKEEALRREMCLEHSGNSKKACMAGGWNPDLEGGGVGCGGGLGGAGCDQGGKSGLEQSEVHSQGNGRH